MCWDENGYQNNKIYDGINQKISGKIIPIFIFCNWIDLDNIYDIGYHKWYSQSSYP